MNHEAKQANITIVVPIFNGAKFVIETLDSIRRQNLSNCNVVLIDDGSTDKSPDIIRKYVISNRLDWLIRLYSKNIGVALRVSQFISNSFNQQNSFILFLGQDDLLGKSYIDNLRGRIDNTNLGAPIVYYPKLTAIDHAGSRVRHIKKSLVPWTTFKFLPLVLVFTNLVPSPGTIIPTALLQKIELHRKNDCTHDWNLWLILSLHCKFVEIQKCHVYYRKHSENLTKRCSSSIVYREQLENVSLFCNSASSLEYFKKFSERDQVIAKVLIWLLKSLYNQEYGNLLEKLIRQISIEQNYSFSRREKRIMDRKNPITNAWQSNQVGLKALVLDVFFSLKFWTGCLLRNLLFLYKRAEKKHE